MHDEEHSLLTLFNKALLTLPKPLLDIIIKLVEEFLEVSTIDGPGGPFNKV
ncbi:MAG: hypothetical protein KatS3mg068_1149 [Candidatus Sericytochromatia bacterium]|nr:MAG: hypothetical protein KatS3mg068_1149 [Candidatus Sericytochromatia bacterium]